MVSYMERKSLGERALNREELMFEVSEKIFQYLEGYKFLPDGRQKDILYSSSFLEGLVARCIYDILDKYNVKYMKTSRVMFSNYITPEALKRVEHNKMTGLIREHMVPKNIYYDRIGNLSKKGTLTKVELFYILRDYYWTCLVTKDENKKLSGNLVKSMGPDWDGRSFSYRYDKAKIKYIPNPMALESYKVS